ncbi:hypothetical protein NDN16_12900 [Aureimonas altamirensis]|uniref:hypothetical protein n=1 Tax=Aureimonas altamirensis TaxID=370622 RepID=UPI002036A5BA|nr:hypothetical protein [Aureimonas altamirensis]MCM2504564.1 hypothetical protein [Aureimonas altamirensis]
MVAMTPLQLAVVRSLDEADIAQRITERAVAAMTTAGCTTHEKIEALLALAMTVALADDDVGRWVELFAAAPGIMEERINGE